MHDFWFLLVEFILRLVAGMAAALLLVPSGTTEGRFFRNKLVIMLGLVTVAVLARSAGGTDVAEGRMPLPLGELIAAAVVAYLGSVVWMLGRVRPGRAALALLFVLALHMAVRAGRAANDGLFHQIAEPISSSLLLGAVVTAMLLGHWYLNAPGMSLHPLQRLVAACFGWLLVRLVVIAMGCGMAAVAGTGGPAAFLVLRWSAGVLLPLILCGMVWWTLKVPNTQSATGILYAMVVLIFIGELVGLLLDR